MTLATMILFPLAAMAYWGVIGVIAFSVLNRTSNTTLIGLSATTALLAAALGAASASTSDGTFTLTAWIFEFLHEAVPLAGILALILIPLVRANALEARLARI
jgi:hypothetical protein